MAEIFACELENPMTHSHIYSHIYCRARLILSRCPIEWVFALIALDSILVTAEECKKCSSVTFLFQSPRAQPLASTPLQKLSQSYAGYLKPQFFTPQSLKHLIISPLHFSLLLCLDHLRLHWPSLHISGAFLHTWLVFEALCHWPCRQFVTGIS